MNALVLSLLGLGVSGEPLLVPPAPPTLTLPGTASAGSDRDHCPSRLVHPFSRLPRICPLEPCFCQENGHGGTREAAYWVKEFPQAAHFPLPRFAADGSPISTDGVLLYEGMRLTVYPDGTYDVSFTATVPDMPVTIRLQLAFAESDLGPVKYTLTLPPLRLEPKANSRPGDPVPNTFQIAHRGYSTLFAEKSITATCSLRRIGTARFGTPAASDEWSR